MIRFGYDSVTAEDGLLAISGNGKTPEGEKFIRFFRPAFVPRVAHLKPDQFEFGLVEDYLDNNQPFVYLIEFAVEIWAMPPPNDPSFLNAGLERIISATKAGQCRIVFSFASEMGLKVESLEGLRWVYDYIEGFGRFHQLNPEQLYFLHANQESHFDFSEWKTHRGIHDTCFTYRIGAVGGEWLRQMCLVYQQNQDVLEFEGEKNDFFYGRYFMHDGIYCETIEPSIDQTERLVSLAEIVVEQSTNSLRPYHFLFMNRYNRNFRRVLACRMAARGLHKNTLLSMAATDTIITENESPRSWEHPDSYMPFFMRRNESDRRSVWPDPDGEILRGWEILSPQLPITIADPHPELSQIGIASNQPYLQSYISIVAETRFSGANGIFITEKTYKPIAQLQPFILLALPGTLACLRNAGYRSFGDFWDETYDSITDNLARLEAILAVIDTLGRKPLAEIREIYHQMLPILRHNQELFYSGKDSIMQGYNNFWQEMDNKN